MVSGTTRGRLSEVSERISAEIEGELSKSPFRVVIPAALRDDYRLHRIDEFARLAQVGWPLFPLFYGLFGLSVWLLSRGAVPHALWASFLRWAVLDAGTIAISLASLGVPRLRARYGWIVVLGGALVFAGKIFLGFGSESPWLALHGRFGAMLVVPILAVALRVSGEVSLLTCALGGLLGVLGVVGFGHPGALDASVLYLGVDVVVSCTIGAILDRQDRLSFLRATLHRIDAARRAELAAELDRLVHEDPLTGLSNRRHFVEVLEREWGRALRSARPLALVVIDVDHFKRFNDTYGHLEGDNCLVVVAAILRASLRASSDVAARFGGEEFVLLLPETDEEGAVIVADRVRAAVEGRAVAHASSSTAPVVTVSIGVASAIPVASASSGDLINAADEALYAAKKTGRNRVVAHATSEERPSFAKPSSWPAEKAAFLKKKDESA